MTGNVSQGKIRVLVVDDSVLMGIQITKILNSDDKIEVVGRAKDGVEALEMVEKLKPQVVTLDVEMPRMDGLTALKHIMVRCPVPVIMLSSLTREGAGTTFDALRFGAVDVIAKPSRRETESLEAQSRDIITRVKQASAMEIRRARYRKKPSGHNFWTRAARRAADSSTRFIGLGTGTGGYHSLLQLVPNLRAEFHDVLVAVMRVSSRFIEPFAAYLASHCAIPVRTARDAVSIETGMCYITSSQDGPVLSREGGTGDLQFEFRPAMSDRQSDSAIDTMFRSLATVAGNNAVGLVMSGAGRDGAEGMVAIRKAGGLGVVQAVTTCMNPSMPRSVLMRGAAEKVLPDYLIADFLMSLDGAGSGSGIPSSPRAASGGSN